MTMWDFSQTKHHVLLCNGGSCMRKGGEEVTLAIRAEIARAEADDKIHTTRTRCNGRCEEACVVIVYPSGVWLKNVTPEDAPAIVAYLQHGSSPRELISHTYQSDHFVRSEGTVSGNEKRVKK